jgi:hypothetical protein
MRYPLVRRLLLITLVIPFALVFSIPSLRAWLYAEYTFHTIPLPTNTHSFEDRKWRYGECGDADISVLYRTERSWDEVQAFYAQWVSTARWDYHAGLLEGGARWRFPVEATPRAYLSFGISRQYYQGTHIPANEALLALLRNGETFFRLSVSYIPDADSFQQCREEHD